MLTVKQIQEVFKKKFNHKRNENNRRVLFQIVALILVIFFLQACNSESQLIKDMDSLYMKPERISSKDRDNVTEVVQKYFPPGMKLSVALKYLVEQGFDIIEYQKVGFRKWPNGELEPYKDDNHKKVAIKAGSTICYIAENTYDSIKIIVEKRARIIITSVDGKTIIKSKGYIWLYGM